MNPFRFNPKYTGARCWLGQLELAIMEIMWAERRATVKRIRRILNRDGDYPYAHTTIMTVMARLATKGLLQRRREGLAYAYTVLYDEDAFIRAQRAHVLAALEG